MAKISGSLKTLSRYVGHEFEPSRWLEVTQSRIDAFADCTEDHQFIHVDPERASKTPLGGTIAHGFLLISLLAPLCVDIGIEPDDAKMALNYGFNRVRFMAPVRSGKRIRARVKMIDINSEKPGRLLLNYGITLEIESEAKPGLIAEWLVAWLI